MFQCDNNVCIDEQLVCDGNNDCLDFSDEEYCREYGNVFVNLCRSMKLYRSIKQCKQS